jgi:hypothetical protein
MYQDLFSTRALNGHLGNWHLPDVEIHEVLKVIYSDLEPDPAAGRGTSLPAFLLLLRPGHSAAS